MSDAMTGNKAVKIIQGVIDHGTLMTDEVYNQSQCALNYLENGLRKAYQDWSEAKTEKSNIENLARHYKIMMESHKATIDVCKERIDRLEKTTLNGLAGDIHKCAIDHGWWVGDRRVPELLCLIHSEISEALEGYRTHDDDNFREEIADAVIRILDMCEHMGIDLEGEILRKHEINMKREYRHGGKKC